MPGKTERAPTAAFSAETWQKAKSSLQFPLCACARPTRLSGLCAKSIGRTKRAPSADVLGCVSACFAAGLNLASEGGGPKKKQRQEVPASAERREGGLCAGPAYVVIPKPKINKIALLESPKKTRGRLSRLDSAPAIRGKEHAIRSTGRLELAR
jgi:hypothetical protein